MTLVVVLSYKTAQAAIRAEKALGDRVRSSRDLADGTTLVIIERVRRASEMSSGAVHVEVSGNAGVASERFPDAELYEAYLEPDDD